MSTRVTDEDLATFEREGYVVVKGMLDVEEDLGPARAEYETVLEALVDRLVADGELADRYDGMDFETRLLNVYRDTGRSHSQFFDFSLPQGNVQLDTPCWFGPAVFGLLTCDRLLDAAERFVGPEIYSTPVQHIRIKPPERVVEGVTDNRVTQTPIHQDNGVILPAADETNMLTVWFPMTDATEEMGCLRVRPKSHVDSLSPHCPLSTGLGIPDALQPGEAAVPVPMSAGDVLFMHRLTCHGSLPNVSDRVRISFDIRYNPIGESTGRDVFPGFVARSRSNPAQELRDAEAWRASWEETRARLAVDDGPRKFNRWDKDSPVCA